MSGDGNKISGDYNTSTGKQNKIGYHAGLTKSSKRGHPASVTIIILYITIMLFTVLLTELDFKVPTLIK